MKVEDSSLKWERITAWGHAAFSFRELASGHWDLPCRPGALTRRRKGWHHNLLTSVATGEGLPTAIFQRETLTHGLGISAGLGHGGPMQPVDMQVVGRELAVKWSDGGEDFVPLKTLRRFCPCAACLGEKDIFGKTYRAPERPYGAGAFAVARVLPVGGYATQIVWGDGHNTGLYTWEWIKRVAAAATVSGDSST